MQAGRSVFYNPSEIEIKVKERLAVLKLSEKPDYIAIVPDGEPTLDLNLGILVKKLKSTGIPVAVITNGSLLDREDVRMDLMGADYVSVKTDTVDQGQWRSINRPYKTLKPEAILTGIRIFSDSFKGKLVTETMLVKQINDAPEPLNGLADFLQKVSPEIAYIATPTRPPAFDNIIPADEESLTIAFKIFKRHHLNTELLTGYEGNQFSSTGNFSTDLLSITAVHPMREEAVLELMRKTGASQDDLIQMLYSGIIRKVDFDDHHYYLRSFGKKSNP
jgi:wyosine [tRNA(Phe)-imidazoG37] synthetase (radical SAM superfamily)